MTQAVRSPGRDVSALPRAVLSAAAGVLHTVERAVIGEGRMRTARGNAWEAVCADRARALHQAEVDRSVAELTAKVPGPVAWDALEQAPSGNHRTVGSSPRSRASQA